MVTSSPDVEDVVDVPLVAVASYGRAGMVSTVDVFPEGVIVVPEKQADTYRALQRLPPGWEIVAIPDDQDGNLSRKRNAILRMYRGRDVVIVDDDYDYLARVEGGKWRRLDHEGVRHLLWMGAVMARDLRTPFWGVNVQVDRRFYRAYTPFSLIAVVLGPFQGFTADRPDDLLYDEELWLKEDYDLSLRVLKRFRRILRFNAYFYRVDHLNALGGQAGKRSMDEEVRQLKKLQQRWGSDIVKFNLRRSVNPIVRPPLKGN